MASLERRNETYRIVFMHGGRKHSFSLGNANQQMAEALLGGVEKTLLFIGQGLLEVPAGCDLIEFVRSGGKVKEPKRPAAHVSTFAELKDAYLDSQANGVIEESSLKTIRQHLRHLERTFGGKFPIAKLVLCDVQRHIDRRLSQRYRGRRIGPLTARKEVSALRTMWNWGAARGQVTGMFPGKGLQYPKTDAKPPFMTLDEIERKLSVGGFTAEEKRSLFESLYLRREEIDAMLEHVREAAGYPWVFPLVATAAHTGARRSELIRVEVTDLDLENGVLLIREKKRSKKQRTTRHVSLTPFLTEVLRAWSQNHPGGRFLFCHSGYVRRSRKRSETTGHQSTPSRPSSLRERISLLSKRPPVAPTPLTKDEAHDHFKRTLSNSRWKVIRGFHTLRHSFISCLAAAGVDQRIIDEFVGHSTEEQRRRYRHLIPDVKHQAIATAFGSQVT